MNKQEAQDVVNETVHAAVGGYIAALLLIALLPILGFSMLFGFALVVAYPGATIVWVFIAGLCLALERSARAKDRRVDEAKRIAWLQREAQRTVEQQARDVIWEESRQKAWAERYALSQRVDNQYWGCR